jgi:hypothetical protein
MKLRIVTIASVVAWLGAVSCGTNGQLLEEPNVGNVSAEPPPSDTLIRLLRSHDPPVTLSVINPTNGSADLHIDVRNMASQEIVGIQFVLAGEHCKAKPGWPVLTYGDVDGSVAVQSGREPPIAPGAGAQIVILRRMLVDVTSVSERTCGRRIPPELAVMHVQFRDGSNWDLGEEVRKAP